MKRIGKIGNNNMRGNLTFCQFFSFVVSYFPFLTLFLLYTLPAANGNPDAKRLYDDLLSNYNRLIRPVSNNTDRLLVKLGLRLSKIIDVVSERTLLTYSLPSHISLSPIIKHQKESKHTMSTITRSV